jgi:3-dehydroquinate dehydratase-2
MKSKVLLLNGPNLNMLGTREPELYGRDTLADIEKAARNHGKSLGLAVDCHQSNHEGELVSWIQKSRTTHAGLILNPAGFGTTSVAILDALHICEIPIIEIHLTNIYKREAFRHPTYVSSVAKGTITGFGAHGYILALDAMARLIANAAAAQVRAKKSK